MRTSPLTLEEEAELASYRAHIIERATSTSPIDHAKAEAAYNALLVSLGREPVVDFMWFDSPWQMHLSLLIMQNLRANLGANLWDNLGANLWDNLRANLWDNLGANLWDNLRANLGDNLGANLWDNLRANLGANLWDNLGANLGANLRANLGDNLRANLWDNLRNNLRANLRANLGDNLSANLRANLRANLGGQLDQWQLQVYGWLQFGNKLADVVCDPKLLDQIDALMELGEHSFWILPLENGAVFCERPVRLVRNEAGLMHYDHDAAIEFKDGWKIFYLSGVEFPEDKFRRIVSQEVTLDEFAQMGLSNNQRPAALQMLRPDRLLEGVRAKLIHTGERGVRLYEVPNFMDTDQTEYCLRMEHPTIAGKEYIEWVRPEIGKLSDADLGMASNRGITKKQYLGAQIA